MVGVPINPHTGQVGGQAAPVIDPSKQTAQQMKEAQIRFVESITGQNAGIAVLSGGFLANEEWKKITQYSEGSKEQMDAIRELIGTKKPDQLLNALEAANPAAKPLLDVARSDPKFAEALKDAVVKDPTFLTVMNEKLGAPGSPIDMNAAASGLQDAQTRANFTEVLKQVAENPKLTGEQAFEVVESAALVGADASNPEARRRYRKSLNVFNLDDPRVEAMGIFAKLETDPFGAIQEILANPQAFADAMKSLTGFQDGGFVASVFNGLAGLTSMWTQDPYVQSFTDHYLPKAQAAIQQDLSILNATPEPIRLKTAEAEVEAEPKATKVSDASTVDRDAAARFENGKEVTKTASLPVTVGGPSFLTGSAYTAAALGIVPAERTQEYGNEMVRNQANNNASLSLTG